MSQYDRNNPFLASVKERYPLCSPESCKNTQHVVLDIKGSNIRYNVGDSIGIYPSYHPEVVEETIKALKATGDEQVTIKKTGESVTLRKYLTSRANITDVSRKFIQVICEKQPDIGKKQFYENLLNHEDSTLLKNYVAGKELRDILRENEEVSFTMDELSELLMPLLPRLYSISSSQGAVGDEVHLTIAVVTYFTDKILRRGVCTYYLGEMAPVGSVQVPLYHQPAKDFTIPEDPSAPMIMIGPGTGVAPYRAFMQERIHRQAKGKNWLFFGEWNRDHHFYYKDFWTELESQNRLKLDAAFSRDQEDKIYVQHKMMENAEELYRWIQEGAYIYICGDKDRMARDVENALLHILQSRGGMDESSAKAMLKQLRAEKRYCKDVY